MRGGNSQIRSRCMIGRNTMTEARAGAGDGHGSVHIGAGAREKREVGRQVHQPLLSGLIGGSLSPPKAKRRTNSHFFIFKCMSWCLRLAGVCLALQLGSDGGGRGCGRPWGRTEPPFQV